jgi:membrane-bound lytic murein transglycosylase D
MTKNFNARCIRTAGLAVLWACAAQAALAQTPTLTTTAAAVVTTTLAPSTPGPTIAETPTSGQTSTSVVATPSVPNMTSITPVKETVAEPSVLIDATAPAPSRPASTDTNAWEKSDAQRSIVIGTDSVVVQPMPLADADLWARIRRGFRMPDLSGNLVANKEQFYGGKPDYMTRMTERSRKYLYHIVEELERRNMPTELALLPFVESAFVVNAQSHAKAAGMWQFIPSTGRSFQLTQNLFRDDRRDVQASTRAALDYLSKLHGMFGDWHLALAAYNWGEGSVMRAQKKNLAAGLGQGYTDLSMPNETREYVPKLQAIKNIVSDPDAFGTRLPAIPNHPYFQAVKLNRDIDVAKAAQLADMRIDDFKLLNPSANKPVILAAGTPQLLLPWNNADDFVRNLSSYSGQLATWTAWRVPNNMRPAEAAQRVGMAESTLREVNRIPPRHSIRGGSVLLVSRSRGAQDVPEQVADNASLALQADPRMVCKRAKVKGKFQQVCRPFVAAKAKPGRSGKVEKAVPARGAKAALKAPVKAPVKAPGKVTSKAAVKPGKPSAKAPVKNTKTARPAAKTPKRS